MKIPDKIKVGGHWIDIKYRSDDEDAYSAAGSNRSCANLMVLSKTNRGSKQESILFHEIIHELSWQHDLELNERQISSLGEGFYQVLVDNGWLK